MQRTWGWILGVWVAMLASSASARVVINEILYHPSNAAIQGGEDAEDLQFVEIVNTGPDPVDLAGAAFTDGITFTFPAGTVLEAGAYAVVGQDVGFLARRGPAIPAGVAVFQWAAGVLDNSGETLRLVDAQGALLDAVTYDDAGLWPPEADGADASLELTNPAYDNDFPGAWRASRAVNGTPGRANQAFTTAPIILHTTPDRGAIVEALDEISVTFAVPVQGVVAADLTVDGAAAGQVACPTCVAGVGAGPWIFSALPAAQANPSAIAVRAGAIVDEDGDAFAGDAWIAVLSVPRVVINEVHYNPASADDDEEFIELYNAEAEPVDVGGWRLIEFGSPGCRFAPNTIVESGGYVVCARNRDALEAASGHRAVGQWGATDKLRNGGEPIALVDTNGTVIDRIEYADTPPWPVGGGGPDGARSPDGDGPSMELLNPGMDNTQGRAWRAALVDSGTPGAVNSVFAAVPAVASESPVRGAIVVDLDTIAITFTEPVVGVEAGLLTIGEAGGLAFPATGVVGDGAGPYVFSFDALDADQIEVVFAPGAIENAGGTPFGGDAWSYRTTLPNVVIHELHYHPADDAAGPMGDPDDMQFIELYNADAAAVDLSGYAMTAGVEHVFADGTILAPGGYLVLAEDAAVLRAQIAIPDEAVVVNWDSGGLANGGENVRLSDPFGQVIDAVRYEDAGEWSEVADGDGPSLELINPALANDDGGAWRASVAANGTPGAPNSVAEVNPAPVVSGVQHTPPLPMANQAVTVTARVVDDGMAAPGVTLHFREDLDPPIAYDAMPMFDDGLHGDGEADDGVYGAVVPGLADQSQLDFYIEAGDGVGSTIAPAAHGVPDQYGNPSQTYLAKFTNEVFPFDAPVYHILVTRHNKRRQEALNGYPTRKQPFDATFIDGAGNIWYNVIERFRGQSSLRALPSSYRVDFPSSRKLQSSLGFPISTLQMNAVRPMSQWLTFDLFNRAGLPSPTVSWAHLRYTGINYDDCCDGRNGYWGLHVVVERLDDDFLDAQGGDLPPRTTSSEGNLYRGRNDATLRWEGVNPATYGVNVNGQNGYEKYNNEGADFWDDLIALCDLPNTPDDRFVEHAAAHIDEDNWARYFALHMLLGNREGGLYRDTGDDYFIYFPPLDDAEGAHPDYSTPQLPDSRLASRSQLVVWDGDSAMIGANETIWRTNVPAPRRFLRHNAFAPIFVKAIEDYAADLYSVETMNAVIDSMPDAAFLQGPGGSNTNPQSKAQFKAWIANRIAFVLNETHDALTLDGGPRIVHDEAAPLRRLQGMLQQAGTHAITVNGEPAEFNVFQGTWAFDLPLVSGANPARIEAWDRAGQVKQRIDATVFYNLAGPDELSVRLRAPARMINDKTLTIDAAITDPIGRVHYRAWDEPATVTVVRLPARTPVAVTNTVFDAHVPVVDGQMRLTNGWGSVSFTLDEGAAFEPGDIEVTVAWQEISATRRVRVIADPAFRDMAGVLAGADLEWGPDETIRVTGGLTVPAGETLRIHPGTLVQVETTGALSNGTLMVINGALDAQGTRDRPIHVFSARGPAAMRLTQQGSASNGDAWRGMQLRGGGESVMRHVILTGAGNGPVVSHPRPPIIGVLNTHSLFVDQCVFVDNNGMAFSGQGTGRYTLRKSLISRVGIGAEYFGNGHTLRIIDSWFTSVGFAPEANNLDGDLLHIDGAASDQIITGSVIQDGGDDGVDHSHSSFRLEHSIIWGIRDKAVSMTGGLADIHNTLIFGSPIGVRGRASISQSSVASNNPIVSIVTAEANIFWPRSHSTCDGVVSHTYVGDPADLGCGEGNAAINPQYTNAAGRDYNPAPGSPALTAGPTGARIGWLGFPYGAVCDQHADCDDGNACTADLCVNQLCEFTAILDCSPCEYDTDCDDGNACTGDLCRADGTCGIGPDPDLSDIDQDGIADACDPDDDGDGVDDDVDNCPLDFNEDQRDADADGVGNRCDNCVLIANANQADADDDGVGDACEGPDGDADGVPDDVDVCPEIADDQNDADADGLGDVCDNCRGRANPDQADADADGEGDVCDDDDDNDGVLDLVDNCALTPNPDQADGDNDGQGDACEDDSDGDGLPNGVDNCEQIPNPDQADLDDDGAGDACDADDDADGVDDDDDNCPQLANADQLDLDADGEGDLCDDDDDGDGLDDGEDNCPRVLDPTQSDIDGDGLGDVCDDDDDGDGVPDAIDVCPQIANPDQADLDGDGEGDICDLDDDGDGRVDAIDNCPRLVNPDQADLGGDGVGDVCDDDDDDDGVADLVDNCARAGNPDQRDRDADGAGDVCDNCFRVPNADQADADADGQGDACEGPDADADGVPDVIDVCPDAPDDQRDGDGDRVGDVCDNCPADANADQANFDGDFLGDACDDDDDEDGILDAPDGAHPGDNCLLLANPDQADLDGDGRGDACDFDRDGDGVFDGADNCPDDVNPEQADADDDFQGDLCDPDDDNDLVPDVDDNCPVDGNPDQMDADADGQGDLCDDDDDDDGVLDADDNCPLVANPDQADGDGNPDGEGDACDGDRDNDDVLDVDDNCPGVANPDQRDLDADGVGDDCDDDDDGDGVEDDRDNCRLLANPDQGDLNGDGQGDVCDPDDDDDGAPDVDDNCPRLANVDQVNSDGDALGDACDADDDNDDVLDAVDNCPVISNVNQADTDDDALGDACDDDDDGDGVLDVDDNCPTIPNADQADTDADGVGDACVGDRDGDGFADENDNCPGVLNPDQRDTDADGTGDECDADLDGDDAENDVDNCPLLTNADQADLDGDGIGDACDPDDDDDGFADDVDNCPRVVNGRQIDLDGDGIGNLCDDDDDGDGVRDVDDICVFAPNPDQADCDGDGRGDVCDDHSDGDGVMDDLDVCPCVDDPEQIDTDEDGAGDACDDDDDDDGVDDDDDNCPLVANPDQIDTNGDGDGDACELDPDDDGVDDADDNCPADANPMQHDLDEDGVGDACDDDIDGDMVLNDDDNCPRTPNAEQADGDADGLGDLCDADVDGDGVGDVEDNCPTDANPDQADLDDDQEGDVCDADDDGDMVDDEADNCPQIANAAQADADMDGVGDACDPDADGDDVDDATDNCPEVANRAQVDLDADGAGDACDDDDDGDGVDDAADNCPGTPNADQADWDDDGRGDACDPDMPALDTDGDGINDDIDTCVDIANPEQTDTDGDGEGDACDDDIDGDGLSNEEDNCVSDANASQLDSDGDGIGDVCDPDMTPPTQPPVPPSEGCAVTPGNGSAPLVLMGLLLGLAARRQRRR